MKENDERHRLRALLNEDVGDDADELIETVQQLRQWQAPQPTIQATTRLVDQLQREIALPHLTRLRRLQNWWPWLLLSSQLRIVQTEIWLATTVIMTIGTVVSLASYRLGDMLPLVFVAPLLSAFGVGLLYDGDVLHMLELEDTTPVSTRLLLLARLTLVFGFNLALGLLGSIAMTIWNADVALWSLVMSWLAPMTFLSALAFLTSVLTSDALAGGLLSLILWSIHIFLRFHPLPHDFWQLLQMPGLGAPANRPTLLIVALMLTVVALWLVGISDRRLKGIEA